MSNSAAKSKGVSSFYATGKRKSSCARVWIKVKDSSRGGGADSSKEDSFIIRSAGNRRGKSKRQETFISYFKLDRLVKDILKPFDVTGSYGNFSVMATVRGGGMTGQAGAIRLGIARALNDFNSLMRPPLKSAGLLVRDSREVERKKSGRRKARKKEQFSKR